MSFTENTLVKKLMELNSSQQSIQTLSLWLIHHRKHHANIVKTWYKELQKVSQEKKLTFMYLANDVIQNSKRKGPEYGKEFEHVLAKAFKHMSEHAGANTFNSLDRLLNIWGTRGVYENDRIQSFRHNLNKNSPSGEIVIEDIQRKRKTEDNNKSTPSNKKSKSSSSKDQAKVKSETIEVNGTFETHVTLNPVAPASDPPEPDELIKALLDLENSASSDALVRGKIANLPPEVSEIQLLQKLEDKDSAAKLAIQVNEAVQLLNDYNHRLVVELDNRKKLTTMLKDFLQEQRELLLQAEQRLEEYNSKLQKIKDVQIEVKNHLHNLPDLKQLPDVTAGHLAPLPSAGDLFNIH